MKILGVDISLIFSMKWEAAEGQELGTAHRRTVEAVTAARAGYDRCFLACDAGPSFRKQVPEYKANRTDRGEAYRAQLQRTIERLQADGCAVIVAPAVGTFPATGAPSYAEADDVLGWAAWQYTEHVKGVAEEERTAWSFTILSDDSDLEQLIDDEAGVEVLKSSLRGGENWNAAKVLEKRGVSPEKVADLKALCGDKSDNYDGFCGEMGETNPPKRLPGVGPKGAASLIKAYGGALEIFDIADASARWEADNVPANIRATLARHGRAQAEKGLFLATICHELPSLDFGAVLAEPVMTKIAEPSPRVAQDSPRPPPVIEGEPVNQRPATATRTPVSSEMVLSRPDFDPLALQPRDISGLETMALIAYNSRCYAQFANYEQVMMCMAEARERGISMGLALRNAYIVKNKLAWATQLMIGLVLKSPLCERFEIVETTMTKATVAYRRKGCAEQMFTFTIEEAKAAGWLRSGANGDSKWITNPRTMLRWACMRECARFVWPDIISGMVAPDEIRNGHILDAEFEDLAA